MEIWKYEHALFYEIMIKREYWFLDDDIRASHGILDIGGHYGFFSLYSLLIKLWYYESHRGVFSLIDALDFLKIAGEVSLNIQLYEPVWEFVDSSFEMMGYKKELTLHKEWVAAKTGEGILYRNTTKSMQSSYRNDTFMNSTGTAEKVSFISFSDVIDQCDNIDLCKMDMEGMEFQSILSLDENRLSKIRVFAIEYHIFDVDMEIEYKKCLEILRDTYEKVTIFPSPYSEKIGYIYARN